LGRMRDIVLTNYVGILLLKFLLTFLGSERIHQHLLLFFVVQVRIEDLWFLLAILRFLRRFQLEIVLYFIKFDLNEMMTFLLGPGTPKTYLQCFLKGTDLPCKD